MVVATVDVVLMRLVYCRHKLLKHLTRLNGELEYRCTLLFVATTRGCAASYKLPTQSTGKVENLHGHVNFNLQDVNLDLHFL